MLQHIKKENAYRHSPFSCSILRLEVERDAVFFNLFVFLSVDSYVC